MKKTVKVVMLPTEKAIENGSIISRAIDDKLAIVNPLTINDSNSKKDGHKANHIYLVSNKAWSDGGDEIKHYDYYYSKGDNRIFQYLPEDDMANRDITPDYCGTYKVIATTDKSLTKPFGAKADFDVIPLPQIPGSFIKAYVKANGEIDEVMVEYEDMYKNIEDDGLDITYFTIKTREDNTVIIHKSKTYSREEVINLINKHSDYIDDNIDYDSIHKACCSIPVPEWNDDKWIEENL